MTRDAAAAALRRAQEAGRALHEAERAAYRAFVDAHEALKAFDEVKP
jgi:hypothetical protein